MLGTGDPGGAWMSRYTASTMSVIGLPHAGMHVTHLERSVAFYEAVFECE